MPHSIVLEELSLARRLADYACDLGVHRSPVEINTDSDHLGAALADAILQAGVNYRTVVRARVDRIRLQFPEAASMPGLLSVIDKRSASDFLMWSHHVKLSRFISLTEFIALQNIRTTVELRNWLKYSGSRAQLLSLHGIGPKTYDYLSYLVGIDCIAVDRHIRTFVAEAGFLISDYDRLKSVV